MASAHLKGSASFTYEHPDNGETTHRLAIPLWDIDPVDRLSRYDWWAESEVDREVVTVGDGAAEIAASVRFDDEPAALKEMLALALRLNLTLTYEDESGGTEYPVKLVSVAGASGEDETPVFRDPDRTAHQAWTARLRLRRVDGGSLDDLLAGGS